MLLCSLELTAPSKRVMEKAWKHAFLPLIWTGEWILEKEQHFVVIPFSNSCIIGSDSMDDEQKGLIYNCVAVDLACMVCKTG